ncbi:MAG: cytidine deaminase [Verrucomicrobiota bacterium]
MRATDKNKLIAAAITAREKACAPYSKFKVGAALLTATGRIISGANVESASYGLTCCAERIALFKALTEGEKNFIAIAVVTRMKGGGMPCGACRQLLAEYAPAAVILICDCARPEMIKEFSVEQLLPGAFRDFR